MGVKPNRILTYAIVSGVLILVGVLASWGFPAKQHNSKTPGADKAERRESASDDLSELLNTVPAEGTETMAPASTESDETERLEAHPDSTGTEFDPSPATLGRTVGISTCWRGTQLHDNSSGEVRQGTDIDTSTWPVYRHEWLGFEIRYPPSHTLNGPDVESEPPKGFLLHRTLHPQGELYGFDLYIEAAPLSRVEQIVLKAEGAPDATFADYLQYITEADAPNGYKRKLHVPLGGRAIPFYIWDRDPGSVGFGDGRDTVVAIVEDVDNDLIVIVHKMNVDTICPELQAMLSTVKVFGKLEGGSDGGSSPK